MDGYFDPLIANQWAGIASNIVQGENPAYTTVMFLSDFPQFTSNISGTMLQNFVNMANATILEKRWHENWRYGMGLFIAHFATLYMQTLNGANPTASQVIAAAQTKGLLSSKSVGDVSAGYDFGTAMQGITGWGSFKTTQYGFQFLTLARMLGKAGSYVW